jgi:nicotinate-nucleotide adenylyltransferase
MLAERMAGYLELDKVLFVPTGRPPHKDESKVAGARHRVEMVRLAIEGNPRFELSTIESDSAELSYTYRTLARLRERCGAGAELYYIVGSDVLEGLRDFKNFADICGECVFAAALRPGSSEARASECAEGLASRYGARIVMVPFIEIGISSTVIRDIIANGGSARYLLPDSVLAYIAANRLFEA